MNSRLLKDRLGRVVFVLFGLVASASAATAGTITRTSSFEYDAATGLLTKEIVEPDNTPLRLETSYTYDAYGNKVAVTSSSTATGVAAVTQRSSSSSYDARGQFPLSSANALGQNETRSYDARFGVVTSLTGPNGLITQWQYDGFGRKILETRADGTQTKWDYLYCAGINGGTTACPSLASYVIVTTPLAADGVTVNGAWSKIYYDSLQRSIKSETLGFDGSSIIAQETQYDSLGRVSRSSLPYYSTQTAQWSSVTYDSVSRVTLTTAPDGSQTLTTYNGLSTTTTNALNQTETKTKNSQGQVIKVIDAQNNTLTYQYDAIGNLLGTTDPNGNIVSMSYDLRGRKTGMTDPDMGTWSYLYNGFGELVQQTDAKGQVATMSYDQLGRMVKRAEVDLVSTWRYDNCTKGIGKLCSSSADNGYQKVNAYDNLGRNVGTTTSIDTSYTEGVTYDANGRVLTQTYPTGLVVSYVYTSLGYLKQVNNQQSGAMLWRADTQNAMGQILQQTYGNNVVTQQVVEATTGRLKNIYAGAGNSVQNFSYQYDQLGNLISRADGNQNLTETFLYDSLNRLTNAVVNSPAAGLLSTNYSYDALGNITNRSDMGSYSYGAANSRPHALKELAFINGGKLQYSYDANGSLIAEVAIDSTGAVISNRGRNETYTSYGMLQTVSSPSAGLSFVYGPEHQRIKQVAPGATTIYLNPDNTGGLFYEKDIKTDGTVEHKHFITAGGMVIALVKQVGTTLTVDYLHRDQLGSTTTITDDQGNVIERLAYEPFGKRRLPDGETDNAGTVVGVNTDRGFTNHEHLEALGLIHMNGRVYDPALGRFMSADPNIQAPENIQSYNRYAYVFNTPLNATDPSGYLGGFVGHFVHLTSGNTTLGTILSPHRLIYKNVSYSTGQLIGGLASTACGWAVALCAAGSSYENSIVHNGSFSQSLRAGATAGASALLMSQLFSWAGDINKAYGFSSGSFGAVATHAVAGCIGSAAFGGSCGNGALAAGFAEGVGGNIPKFNQVVLDTAVNATLGGVASVLGGGKFGNGAITAAFAYLYNDWAHRLRNSGMIVGAAGGLAVSGVADIGTGGFAIPTNPQLVIGGAIVGGTVGQFVGEWIDGVIFQGEKTPLTGEPNSTYVNPGNGQERHFGNDGRADYDIDWHPDHGAGTPHGHNFDYMPDGRPDRAKGVEISPWPRGRGKGE